MSGLAMFGFSFPSLLQFDKIRLEKTIKANLKELYGVEQAPCDTQMRDVLDPVNPEDLRPAFDSTHRQLLRAKSLGRLSIFRWLFVEFRWHRAIFFKQCKL